MCWSCGCLRPTDDHGDPRALTTEDLRAAADHADTDVPGVVANMVRTLSLHRGRQAGAAKEQYAEVRVFKSQPEQRYTLGLAYPANRPDVGKAADGYRDFVSPDVLEEAAWSFLRKGGRVGLQHMDGTEGHGEVVESYIYRGPAWSMKAADGSDQVVMPGDWLLGVRWDEPTWAGIKDEQWNGLSPQGAARRRQPSASALANLRSN